MKIRWGASHAFPGNGDLTRTNRRQWRKRLWARIKMLLLSPLMAVDRLANALGTEVRSFWLPAATVDDDALEFVGFESGYRPAPRVERPGLVIIIDQHGNQTRYVGGVREEVPHG